ncbi:Uncharacterised protein [Enterobacter kobei]|nr:Uncharacterised protein [Enterobacter kobei]
MSVRSQRINSPAGNQRRDSNVGRAIEHYAVDCPRCLQFGCSSGITSGVLITLNIHTWQVDISRTVKSHPTDITSGLKHGSGTCVTHQRTGNGAILIRNDAMVDSPLYSVFRQRIHNLQYFQSFDHSTGRLQVDDQLLRASASFDVNVVVIISRVHGSYRQHSRIHSAISDRIHRFRIACSSSQHDIGHCSKRWLPGFVPCPADHFDVYGAGRLWHTCRGHFHPLRRVGSHVHFSRSPFPFHTGNTGLGVLGVLISLRF